MANMGLTDSGLNRTQQTALSVQRGNADAAARLEQQKKTQELQDKIAQLIEAGAAQKQQQAAGVLSNTSNWFNDALASSYNTAMQQGTSMYNADLAREEQARQYDLSRQDALAKAKYEAQTAQAQAAAKAGLMDPVHAKELCGAGLKRVCELANIPPVLHMGSCVDISRMMILASELSKDSGLNISQLPVVGCAPEWMSEKAVSIGNYVVATGIDTFLGVDPYVKGSSEICDLLTGEHGVKDWVEANYTVETDIEKLGDLMIERIEQKRAALGI